MGLVEKFWKESGSIKGKRLLKGSDACDKNASGVRERGGRERRREREGERERGNYDLLRQLLFSCFFLYLILNKLTKPTNVVTNGKKLLVFLFKT